MSNEGIGEALRQIVEILLDHYTEAEAFQWLCAAQPMLGQPPLQLIAEGKSGIVLECLKALDDGVYL